ncbi:hypothetical protein [Segetibacter aerophilus]|jgi:hypothetical protein|uniref:Lipoprotein n=1 Tax=Segetibacter aerophilus TaxID=670293 RepID=A0A512BD22_9BACT|nr:hypothetical protein [Segetibacter aerophilus]GEO09860.1 hypothetical protein SAE01_23560 [Segetibacter aerophilus]
MKKSKYVELVLITAVLASCNQPNKEWESGNKVYMRSDTTAPYSRAHHSGIGTALLWYYAFRPYGNFNNGNYRRAGYYSRGLSERSNIGSNTFKGAVTRGGFGRGGYSVSS